MQMESLRLTRGALMQELQPGARLRQQQAHKDRRLLLALAAVQSTSAAVRKAVQTRQRTIRPGQTEQRSWRGARRRRKRGGRLLVAAQDAAQQSNVANGERGILKPNETESWAPQ